MELTGQHRLPASPERVWAAFHDPDILADSIPGCRAIENTPEAGMIAKVETDIGTLVSDLDWSVAYADQEEPTSFTASLSVEDEAVGKARLLIDIALRGEGEGTMVTYSARGGADGQFAEIEARLVYEAMKEFADEFFDKFADHVREGVLERAGHAVEHAVEEAAHAVTETAHEVEEAAEEAAAGNLLGGPVMWALIALIVVIVGLYLLT